MNIFYAIFLGFLQGATEFLPISSSGHLALTEHFLGLEQAGLPFDVALHMGTLLAILIYFRKDFLLMARALLFSKGMGMEGAFYRRLFIYLCVGTVPGALSGVFLNHYSEGVLRQPLAVATALGGVGLLLFWAERTGSMKRELRGSGMLDALLIGLFQALAIIPGVSRSGITMTAGLFLGFNRQATARFSFLLSAPIIFGAGVYEIPKIISNGSEPGQMNFYIAGFLASAISGYIFIAWLLKFIKTRRFDIFAYYRLFVAVAVYLAVFLG